LRKKPGIDESGRTSECQIGNLWCLRYGQRLHARTPLSGPEFLAIGLSYIA
jgi:hypothetical protein